MTRTAWTSALALLAAVGTASASEICYGPTEAIGARPTEATVFACPTAGSHTINQLAQLGWRVVALKPVSLGGTQTASQLVLRRIAADAIFANGFERPPGV